MTVFTRILPRDLDGCVVFWGHLAAGEMSVWFFRRDILLTFRLLALCGIGRGLRKTSVREGHAAASKIERPAY